MEFLPHCRAVPEMILPIDVEPREFTRHCLLVRNWLGPVGIKVPFPRGEAVKRFREFGVVAGIWQPTEGDDIEMRATSAGFFWCITARRGDDVRGRSRGGCGNAEDHGGGAGEK